MRGSFYRAEAVFAGPRSDICARRSLCPQRGSSSASPSNSALTTSPSLRWTSVSCAPPIGLLPDPRRPCGRSQLGHPRGNLSVPSLRECWGASSRSFGQGLFLPASSNHLGCFCMQRLRRSVSAQAPAGASATALRFEGLSDVHHGNEEHFVDSDRQTGISRWTLTGSTGEGRRLEVRGCDFYTFQDGQVTCKDSYWKIVEA